MPRNLLMISSVAAVSFVAGSLTVAAHTQSQQAPLVVDVSFMKVEPGKIGEYLRLERELWKPVHQERIRIRQMRSWSLYRVEYPYGAETPYDFVTLNIFNSSEDSERDVVPFFEKVHRNIKIDDVFSRTLAARRLARGELWRRIDHVE